MKPQAKKQVLVFMLAPPLPAVAGGDIYAVNALIPFAEEVDYHLFCYIGGDADIAKVERHKAAYKAVFRSVHLESRPLMPFQMPKFAKGLKLAWHALQGLPFIDASYCSRSAVTAARRLVAHHRIDALEVNSAHLAFFRKFLPSIPGVLVSHNIEADIFPFWMPAGFTGWKAHFIEWVASRSRKAARDVELGNAFGFSAMTFISSHDMARVTADMPKYLMPLHFPLDGVAYGKKPVSMFNVLWMGGFGWYPNAEGVRWYAEEIHPHIRESLERSGIVLHFCGSNPPDELRALHDGRRVHVHGFVDDLKPILDDAHLLIVPLLSGGGIRVKIVEAMSAGIPVLSTSKGCEGIGATDGVDILIADDAMQFAEKLLDCANDREGMARFAEAGLDLMRLQYSEQASLDAKRRAYQDAGVM